MKIKFVILAMIFFNILINFDAKCIVVGKNFIVQNVSSIPVEISVNSDDGFLQFSQKLGITPNEDILEIADVNTKDGFMITIKQQTGVVAKKKVLMVRKYIKPDTQREIIFLTFDHWALEPREIEKNVKIEDIVTK